MSVSATSGTSSISKYYYSKDNGLSYEESTESEYTFSNLTRGTLPYINQLKNGRRKPTLELLDKFSQKLGITNAELITYNEKHYIISKRIDERKNT